METMGTMLIVSVGLLAGLVAVAAGHLVSFAGSETADIELHAFISESLSQILSGIKAANEAETGGKPLAETPKPFLLKHGVARDEGSGIEFDIAVTTKMSASASAESTASIYVIQGKIGGSKTTGHERISRMKFTVFVNQWRG